MLSLDLVDHVPLQSSSNVESVLEHQEAVGGPTFLLKVTLCLR